MKAMILWRGVSRSAVLMIQSMTIKNQQVTMKCQHVLVPVDLHDPDLRAIETAMEIASRHNARITLMHVIEAIDDGDEDEDEASEFAAFYAELEIDIRRQLMELAKRFQQIGLTVNMEIQVGHGPREIVRYSAAGAVDLIVMRSQTIDLDRPVESLKSASHQVSLFCQCPVLLVK